MVTRLDRLARSTRNLLNTLAAITERKAGFRSLGDTWADTTSAHGRLMLTVLGGLAEFERELIRTRTGEGRRRAIARGVKMGRPPKMVEAGQRRQIADPGALVEVGQRRQIADLGVAAVDGLALIAFNTHVPGLPYGVLSQNENDECRARVKAHFDV